MNVMKVLYDSYIQKIKQQQIQRYNERHKNYLKRTGKYVQTKQKNENSNHQNQSKRIRNQTARILHKRKIIQQKQVKKENESYRQNQIIVKNVEIFQEKRIELTPQIQDLRVPKNMDQPPEYVDDKQIILMQCPNCSRKFNQKIYNKHVNVCEKVFKQKRQKFKVKVVDEEAKKIQNQANISSVTNLKKEKKWKKESAMFRKALQINQNKSKNEKNIEAVEQQDDRIQCQGCGRKFHEKVAQRHIQICLKKKK